jgi:hypothetical protein
MNPLQLHDTVSMTPSAARLLRLAEATPGVSVAVARRLPASLVVALSLLCFCAILTVGMLSARDCRVAPVAPPPGSKAEIAIAVPAGRACTILVRAGGADLNGLLIAVQPTSGKLTLRGQSGVIYQPNTGFRGDDAFVFSLRRRSNATSASSFVRVRVTVGQGLLTQ